MDVNIFKAYRDCINEIDDYFEYKCESKKDQSFIHNVLEKLNSKVLNAFTEKVK